MADAVLKLRRGTDLSSAGTPVVGEPIYDTDDNQLYIGDGSTEATGLSAISSDKLPLSGGALTGAVTTNSTFDGVDISARDLILTSTTSTANAALPKAGGTMTGDLLVSAADAEVEVRGATGDTGKLLITADDGAAGFDKWKIESQVNKQLTIENYNGNSWGEVIGWKMDGRMSGSCFLDEDDLGSNAANKLASQQSIKAYVDAQEYSPTRIKILPADFVPNDDSSYYNVAIDDSTQWAEIRTNGLEVWVQKAIPEGFTATSLLIYSNNSSHVVKVYENEIQGGLALPSAISTSENTNSVVDFSALTGDVVGTTTNYISATVILTSTSDVVAGGYITIQRT
jgi:hypothetical protein